MAVGMRNLNGSTALESHRTYFATIPGGMRHLSLRVGQDCILSRQVKNLSDTTHKIQWKVPTIFCFKNRSRNGLNMSSDKIALQQVETAAANNNITASAAENIRVWLTEPRYAAYQNEVIEHVRSGKWDVLDDVFWTIIPFGTGGRRGRMYPIGSNAINERTIGESARGLAEYVAAHAENRQNLSCAIAFDTRHNSIEFSRLCAEIMVAAGFKVYYLDEHRSTPELSFLVRLKDCSCGIMVTASHNPPSDNAVKCYWSTGGQLLPPHDQGVIDCVMNVGDIPRTNFEEAVAKGLIELCGSEVDEAFVRSVSEQRFDGPRDLRLIYSPLHGVGTTAVVPTLAADGFTQLEVYGPHAAPDGDFTNVPDHVSNPENRKVFDAIIQHAQIAISGFDSRDRSRL